jgi:hypothetical protein
MKKTNKKTNSKDELRQMIEKMRQNRFDNSGFKPTFAGPMKKGAPSFRRPQNKG